MGSNRFIPNNKGFSLVQVLMVALLMSLISMFVADILIQMKKSELKAEMNYNMREFDIELSNILLNRKSCDETIAKANPYISPSSFPIAVERIWQKSNMTSSEVRFFEGQEILGGKLIIEKMFIEKQTPVAIVLDSGVSEVFLVVHFVSKVQLPEHLKKTLTRKIPLSMQFSNQSYVSCSSVSIIDLATMRSQVCTDIGGTYNQATGKCDLANSPQVLRTICGAFGATVSGNKCSY